MPETRTPIASLDDLRLHLCWAREVEHTTLPPYLYALYSLVDQHSPGALTIRHIVIEEMLHMALVANIHNAVGGRPSFDQAESVPCYPCVLPHHRPDPPIELHLRPCHPALIESTMLRIEQPELRGAAPESDDYTSLGQFYHSLELGLRTLVDELGEGEVFSGDPARQLRGGYWGGRGKLIPVTDLASATAALDLIIEQGEGSTCDESTSPSEEAHYWRLEALLREGDLGEVHPVRDDPTTRSLPEGPVRALSKLFDDCYALMLGELTTAVNGEPDRLMAAGQLMKAVLRPLANLLARTAVDESRPELGNAGAAFMLGSGTPAEVQESCQRLTAIFPQVGPVSAALKRLALFERG